jgi:ribosomal protection tetracycline resistance protein
VVHGWDVPDCTVAMTHSGYLGKHAVPLAQVTHGAALTVEGDIPAARVHQLRAELPALTRGEGVLECAFDRYEPVTGVAPTRPRTDYNPLNREEYVQRVTRRASLAWS